MSSVNSNCSGSALGDCDGPRFGVFRVDRGMITTARATSRRRIRHCLVWSLAATLCIGAATAGAAPSKSTATGTAQARAAVAMERETLDGVVAASLVGALSEQLGGRAVKIRLKQIDVQTMSLRDRLVSGQGEMQIEASQDWIGFRFSTLYDAIFETAGYPELSIGTVGPGGRTLPNDSKLVRELDDRVVGMLGQEFGYQQVRLQLDRIDTVEAGARYLRIDAQGIADFGLDGTAPTRVEALYDREQNAWLRVTYTLDAAPPAPSSTPVGSR